MIDPDNVPNVDDDEILARYIVAGQSTRSLRKYVRENNTVKPQLFLPYKHVELSVNRYRDCDESEIWNFGRAIAVYREKELHGLSDIAVASCTFEGLTVVAKPIRDDAQGVPDNPNHADIEGFPSTKEDQLSLAEKLAASASDRITPPESK